MLRKIAATLALVASMAAFNSANALVLDCKNVAHVPISIAVSYLDYDGKTWMVEGWYNLDAGAHAKIELDSSNDVFYIYGEFPGNQKVAGGEGALELPVYYRTFKYIYGQQPAKPDETVFFVQGVATNGLSEITLGPLSRQ